MFLSPIASLSNLLTEDWLIFCFFLSYQSVLDAQTAYLDQLETLGFTRTKNERWPVKGRTHRKSRTQTGSFQEEALEEVLLLWQQAWCLGKIFVLAWGLSCNKGMCLWYDVWVYVRVYGCMYISICVYVCMCLYKVLTCQQEGPNSKCPEVTRVQRLEMSLESAEVL